METKIVMGKEVAALVLLREKEMFSILWLTQ